MTVLPASSRQRRSLLALVTFSLATFAACRDLAGPRDAVVGGSAERSSIDSPDLVTLTLPAADPWNGRSSLGPSVYGTYTKPTVVRITAAGFHNRTPNYSIIGGAVSMGPSGNTGVSIGASGIAVTQGGSVEPSATVYATVTGNLTGAQRYGYSEREYAGFFGVWCGRTYGNRCDEWNGTTTVTVTRLNADLAVTAESTTVSPGSTPYFDYRSSPMTVEGYTMQYPVDSSHWEPDPDSLGGDAEELAVHANNSGACQSAYYPACRRKIVGSGTFRLSAWVNGKWIQKSVHVTAPDLNLTAAPDSVIVGDSVSFTPTWEDGTTVTAGSITAWLWSPEASPGTTIPCGAGTVICKRPVNESGWMTVHIARNGVIRSAKTHVVAKKPFTLTVRGTPRYVGAADTVEFEPAWSDGDPITTAQVISWSWAPDTAPGSTTACAAGVVTCKRPIMESGTMTVVVSRDGVNHTAEVHVGVVPCPADNSLLNDPVIRNGFMSLYMRSRFDVSPGTGYTSGDEYSGTKKERGGFVFMRRDGTAYAVEDSTALSTECYVNIDAVNWSNFRKDSTDSLVALVHTHPTRSGELAYGCPDEKDSQGNVLLRHKRWPGDGGGRQDATVGDQWAAGGGSGGDWTMGSGLVDGYVLNADGELWRLPREGADSVALRKPNFQNMVQYKYNMLAICDW